MSLIKEIEEQLPLPVYPRLGLCQVLQEQGVEVDTTTELRATKVFDSGEAGGIVCSIIDKGGRIDEEKQPFVVSLTHLRVKQDHPLSQKISEYQRRRRKNLRGR
ncbi:hypothetical protein AKJ38_03520 [candidate division MSBL1 archaeon SCGC-AAA259I14]|uniref:Uncharacterized protein n=1 Tax=candidate division MSBL1 archaeon SCGC-AAA259I14 TaxID=1698268 RepID=A0A133UQ13_9EURY|nr:hypothetical protein AKJ38_03520 [candidate division MSBL1 archaeon SCGC-AAA259I14]